MLRDAIPVSTLCPPHFPTRRFFLSPSEKNTWILLNQHDPQKEYYVWLEEFEIETSAMKIWGIYDRDRNAENVVGNMITLTGLIESWSVKASTHYLLCPKRTSLGKLTHGKLHYVQWLDGPDMCILFNGCLTWTELEDKINVL